MKVFPANQHGGSRRLGVEADRWSNCLATGAGVQGQGSAPGEG